MKRVLVAGKIHQSGLDLLRDAPGVTLDYMEDISPTAYLDRLDGAHGVLLRTQPMPAEVIDNAPALQIVSRHGVGYDAVDVAALNRRGLPLAIVGDLNSSAVAEHALALILATVKRMVRYDRAVRSGSWNDRDLLYATELDGHTVLVIGFGRIGRKVGALCKAFGMRVLAHDPYHSAEAIAAAGATPAPSLEAALAEADVVTLHVPKQGEKPLIGAREIALMKRSAVIVSTARGGMVDEAALAAALAEDRLAGAGLDVLAAEPPSPDDSLLASDRVILSPHIAGLTFECAQRMAVGAARNILDHFAGQLDPALVVNATDIGYTERTAAPH